MSTVDEGKDEQKNQAKLVRWFARLRVVQAREPGLVLLASMQKPTVVNYTCNTSVEKGDIGELLELTDR